MHQQNKIEKGIDLSEFYDSVEWDIMAVPAQRILFQYAGMCNAWGRK